MFSSCLDSSFFSSFTLSGTGFIMLSSCLDSSFFSSFTLSGTGFIMLSSCLSPSFFSCGFFSSDSGTIIVPSCVSSLPVLFSAGITVSPASSAGAFSSGTIIVPLSAGSTSSPLSMNVPLSSNWSISSCVGSPSFLLTVVISAGSVSRCSVLTFSGAKCLL